jgi:aldose 1-epimerase
MITISQQTIAKHLEQDIIKYTLQADNGFKVSILNYGGIIWEISTPDKDGNFANVVKQHPSFDPENPGHLGAITGRIAGRISNAQFQLEGKLYQFSANNNQHLLHGGKNALDKKIWSVKKLANGIELSYFSPDGENGFPGNVEFKVSYLITQDWQLTIQSEAHSDKTTPINLTNHSYFDLTATESDGGRQLLRLDSDYFGEIDANVAFTNHLSSVDGTPFDFRHAKAINQEIHANNPQLKNGNGYDHPFVLNHSSVDSIHLYDPVSERNLKVQTSEPVVVIYTANHFSVSGSAICLETQRIPDAINLEAYRESVLCAPEK